MIFLFDKFKKLKGTVRNRHTISLLYERERNGLYTVSAEIPLKITDKKTVYNYHKKVKDSDFLGHYDREGRFQLHKIASVDIEDSSIFIKGVHLFFDEAKAGAIIQERRFRDSEIVDGARVAFDTIGWSVVDVDVSDRADYIFYNVSPLEARAILVETFDYEFDYWLDFDGKNIRNKQISIKREMGKDSNKRYNYGHNVLNIKVEQDYSEIYTAVIGRGKGEDLGDDAYGRRIEYTDVEWKTPTHPMNKPKGSRVLHDENATQLFGYHENGEVSPRTKVEIFEDIEDPAKLLRASYNWLKENSVPKAVFSLKVPDGDGLDLGDKVHVIYRDIDLVKHTRVTKVVDDLVSGNRDVEFGDTAYFKTDRRLSGVKSELKRVGGSMSSRISRLKAEFDKRFDDEVKQWRDDFEQAVIDAEAAVEAMRVTMTEEFEAAQKAFEVEFNQSVSDAKKHADAVADAKASQVQGNLDSFAGRHEQLVGELQGNIVNINGEIADARADVSGILGRLTGVDGSISGIKGSLTEIEGTLTNTKTQLESQITDARTELEKSISDARAEIEGLEVGGRNRFAKSKVVLSNNLRYDDQLDLYYNVGTSRSFSIFKMDSLGLELNQKYILAYEIKSNIPELRLRPNTYINGAVSSVNNNPELIEGEWVKVYTEPFLYHTETTASVHIYFNQDLASSRDIEIRNVQINRGTMLQDYQEAPEDTDNKITNINQTITNIEGELSSKVEQTEVDALKGTVERQGTLLTQTAEEVSSKAEKSVVDTLTGRVSNAESSVTQNAEEIAKKLTKSVYDEDKTATDAQITQWSNLTTETAEGLEQTISRVSTAEGKISKAQADIIANADEIALKATQSDLDSVTGRVSTAESELSVQAGQIALRATKKELEGVEGRVSATEASLTVLDDEISSVVGRVSTNESNISSVVQDVNSITSTVATLEGDVATQGSKIEQTEAVISSKVWMDDIAGIGANLIPQSANAWERGGLWIENGGETGVNNSMRMVNKMTIKPSTQYTISDSSAYVSAINNIYIHQYSSTGAHITYRTIPRGGEVTFTTWSNADTIRVSISPMEGFVVLPHFIEHLDGRIKVKLEEGSVATPMVNAISQLQQTADNLSFKVAELTNIDGEEILTQSDISIESDRILIGSQQISSNTLASLISVSPSSIDLITDKMNLTGNLNVKGQIESISTSAVKADFANIFAGTADIQFIVAKHLASDAIQARHLYVSNAMAEKLIANSVMASEVKALSMTAVEANIGSLRTQILTSNVIKSSHIAGGTALIDKIFSSNAMFERMMAKSGFVRTLNTVSLHANSFSSSYPGSNREITMENGRARFKYGSIVIENASGRRTIIDGKINRSQSMTARMPKFQSSDVSEEGSWYRTSSTSYVIAHEEYFVHEARHIRVAMAVHRWGTSAWCDGRMETRSGKISNFLTTDNEDGSIYGWLKIDMGEPLDRPVSDSLIYTFKTRNGSQSKRMHLGNRFLTDFPENI